MYIISIIILLVISSFQIIEKIREGREGERHQYLAVYDEDDVADKREEGEEEEFFVLFPSL